jgi:hypothetical protein
MLALALLFIVIIGLLSVIVWLLQKYFDIYSSLHSPQHSGADELQSRFNIQQKETLGSENEINAIINNRLMEMERIFPTIHHEGDHPEYKAEVLTETLKHVFTLYMNLLKVKQQDRNI